MLLSVLPEITYMKGVLSDEHIHALCCDVVNSLIEKFNDLKVNKEGYTLKSLVLTNSEIVELINKNELIVHLEDIRGLDITDIISNLCIMCQRIQNDLIDAFYNYDVDEFYLKDILGMNLMLIGV